MTRMQLIVPPLEDSESRGDSSDGASRSSSKSSDENQGVMSKELREHFEAMKRISREARRAEDEQKNELRRKEREKAVETALAADEEISRWQAGIAELEALLAEDEQEIDVQQPAQGRGNPPVIVRFPVLPPIVPPEEDEEESSSRCRDSGH